MCHIVAVYTLKSEISWENLKIHVSGDDKLWIQFAWPNTFVATAKLQVAPDHRWAKINIHALSRLYYVIVIARGQGFMAVNRPESEGVARGQGQFTSP